MPKGLSFDGEALSDVLIGETDGSRIAPLYFRRPPDRDSFYGDNDLPDLGMRQGKWKLLCEFDGSDSELYDLENDLSGSPKILQSKTQIFLKK